jgi:hypothetical protein
MVLIRDGNDAAAHRHLVLLKRLGGESGDHVPMEIVDELAAGRNDPPRLVIPTEDASVVRRGALEGGILILGAAHHQNDSFSPTDDPTRTHRKLGHSGDSDGRL